MEMSPNDIRNFEFSTHMRGYDKDAVDNFREQVAQTIEALKQENLRLSMECESVRLQLNGLKQFEDAIKNAAIDARRNADMTVANAKHEAELIVSRATNEAEQVLSGRAQRHAELESSIQKLELTRKSYLSKLRQLIGSHLEWVQELAQAELPEAQRTQAKSQPQSQQQHQLQQEDRIEITDTKEMTAQTRETVATVPSKQGLAKTEEANAASKIVEVDHTITNRQVTDAVRAVVQEEEQPKQIDPELASALENYRKVGEAAAQKEKSESNVQTGKVKTAPTNPAEYAQINLDGPAGQQDQGNDLAKVLDNVVSKFEEEMDKAAKS
jgi:cell division initiation protein